MTTCCLETQPLKRTVQTENADRAAANPCHPWGTHSQLGFDSRCNLDPAGPVRGVNRIGDILPFVVAKYMMRSGWKTGPTTGES